MEESKHAPDYEDWRTHLAQAVNRGKGATFSRDEVKAIYRHVEAGLIQCGQPERDARLLAESNIELLQALEALVDAIYRDFKCICEPDLDADGSIAAHAQNCPNAKAEAAIRKAHGE